MDFQDLKEYQQMGYNFVTIDVLGLSSPKTQCFKTEDEAIAYANVLIPCWNRLYIGEKYCSDLTVMDISSYLLDYCVE